MVTDSEDETGGSGPVDPNRPESPTEPLPSAQGDSGQSQGGDEGRQLSEEEREIRRQRDELTSLHAELDTRERRHRRVTLLRQIVAAVLVFIAALGVTASVIGVWAGRTTLNTDRWVETVSPLSEDPAVRAAVSTYTTEQIFTSLNVEQRVKEALPPRAAFLASPLTG